MKCLDRKINTELYEGSLEISKRAMPGITEIILQLAQA
jgi:hypothetical protein